MSFLNENATEILMKHAVSMKMESTTENGVVSKKFTRGTKRSYTKLDSRRSSFHVLQAAAAELS